ncbi:ribosomal biogenesis protein gar2 [Colletotrichum truncatum]|uniref:Ribosomal biogenesis protein gar2 n=1 Tax=Colletotrichum truncatum TaxID=5467 RepID=A0ACC3Z9V2_COLTU|nr:ribosomal biogenesis protein gar2 [Colletotrichum truncatum]KAF6796020.1 ribosomal biogenesis protein gar2 [Colletotrichum truncatum]
MAPELRKRTRSVTAAEKPAAKKATKAEKVEPAAKKTKVEKPKAEKVEKKEDKTPKRKAPEEASPVATKKQKPAKATPKSKKAAPKPEAVEEAEPETTEVVEEVDTSVIPVEDATDSDDEVDADIQALAAGLDPEDAPEGDGTVFKAGQDVGKVPKFNKKQKKLTEESSEEPGVVFISRLPHGFYEHELKGYFSQFGPINRLRLARNKKTGASKHWAFIEFAEESTAEIVAKTMDSYLLFGHILKVKTVPRESLHENLWKGANKRFKKIPWNKIAANEVAKKRTESNWSHKVSKEEKKRAERAEKLKELGYDFEAPKLKEAVAPPPEPMAIDAPEETKAIEAAPAEEETAPTATEEVEEAEKPKATKGKAKKGGKARKSKA